MNNFANNIWRLCIFERYYTCGDINAYNNMLETLCETWNVEEVASDIYIHSDDNADWNEILFKVNEIYDKSRWIECDSKSILDWDGFYTDYTMYWDCKEDRYVFIHGDKELYNPTTTHSWDWECESQEEAYDWFENYNNEEDN